MDKYIIARVLKVCSMEQVEKFLEEVEEFAMEKLAVLAINVGFEEEPEAPPPPSEEVEPINPPEEELPYETKFHHTNKGALVLCPGQTMDFDSCSVDGVDIPRHNRNSGGDKGRELYMHTSHRPTNGDIICKKGGKEYKYKSGGSIIYGSCNSNSEPDPPEEELPYETKFHHTTTGSSDGGKSLVMCPGQDENFDACYCGNERIPYHGLDTGRIIYWSMFSEPKGDIVCVDRQGKKYRYKADKKTVYGSCR
jgi:hypothetical protein